MSTREERIQNVLEILGGLQPEELYEVYQRMPAAPVAAKAVDSTDGGGSEEMDKERKSDAPVTVEEPAKSVGLFVHRGSEKGSS